MGVIEENIGAHTRALKSNTALLVALGDRFDGFETSLQVERRLHEDELARKLDKWQSFSILKFDESTARQTAIEDNQALHMASTAAVQEGIGTLLGIVSTLQTVKKTAGRFGRCGLWLGGKVGKTTIWLGALALAWTAIKTVLTTDIKIAWPWL